MEVTLFPAEHNELHTKACLGSGDPKRDCAFCENHYEFTGWCDNSGFEIFFFFFSESQIINGLKILH